MIKKARFFFLVACVGLLISSAGATTDKIALIDFHLIRVTPSDEGTCFRIEILNISKVLSSHFEINNVEKVKQQIITQLESGNMANSKLQLTAFAYKGSSLFATSNDLNVNSMNAENYKIILKSIIKSSSSKSISMRIDYIANSIKRKKSISTDLTLEFYKWTFINESMSIYENLDEPRKKEILSQVDL